MLKATYLLFDLGALLAAISVGAWKHQVWLHEWRRTVPSVLSVAVPFIAWDVSAVARGHWSFNPEFTLGITIGNQPIEELLFFIVIPLVAIATWELVPVRAEMGKWFRRILWGVIGASAVLLFFNVGREYSMIISVIAAVTAGLWLVSLQPIRHWVLWMGILFGLFLVVNTVFTALPIVEYGAAHYSSLRIGTIPIEDFFYNFALANLTILSWLYIGARQPKAS